MTSARHADIVHETSLLYYLLEGVFEIIDRAEYTLRFDVKSHEDPMLSEYFERVIGERSLDGIIIVPQFLRDYGLSNYSGGSSSPM